MDLKFHLHRQQTKAFTSTATEILYGGAAGGGKSHLMRIAAIAWSHAIPGLQTYIFRRTSPDLLANHFDGPSGFPALLSEWIDGGACQIHYGVSEVRFKNGPSGDYKGGSRILLRHCQHEKDRHKYQGSEIHVLMVDEATHFNEVIYRFLRGRVRLGGLQVPEQYKGLFPRILCASNPGGVGHNWVKAAFVDNAPPGKIVQMPPSEGGMKRQYIPARLDDNPTLLQTDPNYIDRLEALGNPELVRAMRDGDWNILSGAMFSDVWDEGVHVVEPFPIPRTWLVDRSFDWGSSKPYSCGWWCESNGETVIMKDGSTRTFPAGTVFRVAEIYGWTGKPDEGVKETAREIALKIKQREAELLASPVLFEHSGILPGPADSAIFNTENGHSIAVDMADEGITWLPADKRPGSRVNGWETIRARLRAALEQPPEHPALYVFNTCRQFIRTIPSLPRSEVRPDDADTKAEDHIADETRYRLTLPDSARGAFRHADLS